MKTVFQNATVLDGSVDMAPQEHLFVTVEDGKILSIDTQMPTVDSRAVDLQGRCLMPGLINLHVHLPASGKPKKRQTDSAKLARTLMSNALGRAVAQKICLSSAQAALYSGVTTIRTVGGVGSIDTQVRDLIASGRAVGPRILAANMAVSVPGGHMAGSVAHPAVSVEDAVAHVRSAAAQKADLIKLMITGGVLDAKVRGEPGEVKMPAAYVKACCDEAHRLGLPVAAHVESPAGVRLALENGVDTIEHGAMPDEEILSLFRQRHAAVIATISPALPFALFSTEQMHITEEVQYNGRVVMDGVIDCAKAALENGIPVGMGTDTGCPYITHYDMWREVCYFCKYLGVTPAHALHIATQGNAEILGLSDVGRIAVGQCADFLITDKNPLEDLSALRTPYMVVAGGRIFESPRVKKYPEVEQALDQLL
jgi:imidazolonepropionase-like amidohydrolase